MASILELYIQLGFHPAVAHCKVPDPATQAKYLHYKYQSCGDSRLKNLRSHTALLDLLQRVRDYLEDHITNSLKLKVERADIKSTPIPEVLQMTKAFLNQDDIARRYWSDISKLRNSTYGPVWPRDKAL